MSGWIGVDLDGTLAKYDGWVSETHIGDPIELMIERVKRWLDKEIEVKIFTARVSGGKARDVDAVRAAIEEWCEKHIGVKLPITNEKDYQMHVLYDDRCVQIIQNTGERADGVVD